MARNVHQDMMQRKVLQSGPSEKQNKLNNNLPSFSEEVRMLLVFQLLSSGLFPEVVFGLHFCVNFLGLLFKSKKKKRKKEKIDKSYQPWGKRILQVLGFHDSLKPLEPCILQ